MNIIIVGCGKTGSRLATKLDELGYDVSVLDSRKEAFELLDDGFSGLQVHGDVTDVEVLKNAGCDNADIGIVVTNNDNTNIMVARTMNVEFGMTEVFVRLLDTSRESVFRKLGLKTVCATRLEAEIFLSLVTDRSDEIDSIVIGEESFRFVMEKPEKRHLNKPVRDIPCHKDEMIFALRKKDGSVHFATQTDLTVEEGDKIIYAIK